MIQAECHPSINTSPLSHLLHADTFLPLKGQVLNKQLNSLKHEQLESSLNTGPTQFKWLSNFMKPFLKHISKTIVNSSCYITPNIAWLWMGGTGWHVTNSRLSNISLLLWIRVLALLTHSEEIYWQVKSWHTEVSGDCITHWAVQDVLEIVTSPGLALRVQCRTMVLLLSPAWPYSLLNRIK